MKWKSGQVGIEELNSFRLTRFFSGTSLIGIVVVTTCLIWAYRELAVHHLIEHESRANENITRAFSNSVWDQYRDFVLNPAERSRDELVADPVIAQLRSDVLAKMRDLPIVKIKIYNLEGLTVFSTDETQIGEDKSDNPAFQGAVGGTVTSHITYREKFDAFEGTLNNRNLIASYVPIRSVPGAAPESVFEVYSDVTELLKVQSQAQWQIAGIVLALLGTLYFFLYVVVRKADRIIGLQEDQRAIKEDEIRHQAFHDDLTGLPNRANFSIQLDESLSLAKRHNHTGALMFIDLDHFKLVNDKLGHHAGDTLLKEVSARIRASLRSDDFLFRIGGDEFTVILPEVENLDEADALARRVLEAVSAPVMINQHEEFPSATIGIGVYPKDGDTAELLLKNADAAMYNAKEYGRGSHAFYKIDMNLRAQQRLDLENSLRQGFRDSEFTLFYQPRLDTGTREVVALEALLRWVNPSQKLSLPTEFLSVLEDTGMINTVGEWVLRTVCVQIKEWQLEGMEPLRVSVNISTIQFQSDSFVGMVKRVLHETGVSPELIELELNESELISNIEHALASISSLKALGISISIDDFGTGYSSLNYLRQFDVDYLKIDRSFVTEISSNIRARTIAASIIDLAKELNISVVAEGVETEAEAEFFSSTNCGELQGILFCEPLPVDQLLPFLETMKLPGTGDLPKVA